MLVRPGSLSQGVLTFCISKAPRWTEAALALAIAVVIRVAAAKIASDSLCQLSLGESVDHLLDATHIAVWTASLTDDPGAGSKSGFGG